MIKLRHRVRRILISLSDSRQILVSPILRNMGNMPAHLLSFENRESFTPYDAKYLQADEHLARHRERFRDLQG